ncbi:MAG: DUF5615 family PIN-like protein [Chloroflexota bacterium]
MRFLADENLDNDILRGIRYALGANSIVFDVIRVQDTAFYQAEDSAVLAWAAQEQRILLTHDAKTIPRPAYERVTANLPMPGVFVIDDLAPLSEIIAELLTIMGASDAEEWRNLVLYLPLR